MFVFVLFVFYGGEEDSFFCVCETFGSLGGVTLGSCLDGENER